MTTIREVREILFKTDKQVLFKCPIYKRGQLLTNKEARDLFYSYTNQDQQVKVIDKKYYLIISNN